MGGAGLGRRGPGSLVSKCCSWVLEGQEEGMESGPDGCKIHFLAASDLSGRKSAYVLVLSSVHSMYQEKWHQRPVEQSCQDPPGLPRVTMNIDSCGQGLPLLGSASPKARQGLNQTSRGLTSSPGHWGATGSFICHRGDRIRALLGPPEV